MMNQKVVKKSKVCLTCGDDISHKYDGAKYCNYDCYWNSDDIELKKKQRQAAKRGFVNHIKNNGVWNTGETKDSNETLKKISESRMGDDNPYNRAINEGRTEVYLKGKTMEEVFGVDRASKIKNKIRKSVIKQYKDGNTRSVDTTPELEFKQLLEENGIQYVQSFVLSNKIFDFFIPECNTVVEIDGIYWHGKGKSISELNETQLKNYKNDKLKNKIMEDSQYKLIRIWSDEIEKFNIKQLKSYE